MSDTDSQRRMLRLWLLFLLPRRTEKRGSHLGGLDITQGPMPACVHVCACVGVCEDSCHPDTEGLCL